MPQQVMVNGKNYDAGNVKVIIFGIPMVGIENISYMVNQGTTNNYSLGYEPISYGKKQVEYTGGKMTIYKEEALAIASKAPDKRLMNIPPFSFIVMLSGDGVTFETETVNNVRLTNDPFNAKMGDTKLSCELTFDFAGVDKKY